MGPGHTAYVRLMQWIGDLIETAEGLGTKDALGIYPFEETVLDATLKALPSPRLIRVTDSIKSKVADAYDEARALAVAL